MNRFLLLILALISSIIVTTANANGGSFLPPPSNTNTTQAPIFTVPTPSYQPQANGFPINRFNTIFASGQVNIELMPPGKYRYAYYKSPDVSVQMVNHVIYINAPKNGPTQTVLLWGNYINGIFLTGNASLNAEKLDSRMLYVTLSGHSNLRIRGVVTLAQLLDSSSGLTDIRWVRGKQILLQSTGNGTIRLAGVTQLLNAKVFGRGTLDAKFLRANDVLVHTGQLSFAQVTPVNSLAAFAQGESNIYYFKTPLTHLNRDSIFAGNVLQMGYWR